MVKAVSGRTRGPAPGVGRAYALIGSLPKLLPDAPSVHSRIPAEGSRGTRRKGASRYELLLPGRSNPINPLQAGPAIEVTVEARYRSNAVTLHNGAPRDIILTPRLAGRSSRSGPFNLSLRRPSSRSGWRVVLPPNTSQTAARISRRARPLPHLLCQSRGTAPRAKAVRIRVSQRLDAVSCPYHSTKCCPKKVRLCTTLASGPVHCGRFRTLLPERRPGRVTAASRGQGRCPLSPRAAPYDERFYPPIGSEAGLHEFHPIARQKNPEFTQTPELYQTIV